MLIADPTASAAAQAFEVPAVIAGSVNLLRFSAALAQAGLHWPARRGTGCPGHRACQGADRSAGRH